MKFIEDVKVAWRHFSTIALAAGTAVQGVWMAYPSDLKAKLPVATVEIVSYVTGVILLWGLIGKFIQQPPKASDAPSPDPKP